MKKHSKWIVAVLTFAVGLLPILCYADENIIPNAPISFAPSAGDLSISFLSKIFGFVPGVELLTSGGTKTVMAVLFGAFNGGILAISGIFLGYVIFKLITENSMDSSALSKPSTIFMPIRSSLGMSLLVPQHVSGYSAINSLIMWIVVQGVGLADYTWIQALNYVKDTGKLYSSVNLPDNKQQNPAYSFINWDLSGGSENFGTAKQSDVGSADVLRCLTCAYSMQHVFRALQKNFGNSEYCKSSVDAQCLAAKSETMSGTGSGPNSFYLYYFDKQLGTVTFPYIQSNNVEPGVGTSGFLSKYGLYDYFFKTEKNQSFGQRGDLNKYTSNNTKDIANINGVCGSIKYKVDPQGSVIEKQAENMTKLKGKGLRDMIDILQPIASDLVQKTEASDPEVVAQSFKVYINSSEPKGENDKSFFRKKPPVLSNPSTFLAKNLTVNCVLNPSIIGADWCGDITGADFRSVYGAVAMANAAMTYQVSLLSGDVTSSDKSDEDKKFADAKKLGWIGAGWYYDLLTQYQEKAAMMAKSYRLQVYQRGGSSKEYARDGIGGTIFQKIAIEDGEKNVFDFYSALAKEANLTTDDTLKNSIYWIEAAYPYAQVQEMVVQSSGADAPSGSGNFTRSYGAFLGKSWLGHSYMTLGDIAKITAGVALLFAPFPGVAVAGGVLLVEELQDFPLDILYFRLGNIFSKWASEMGPKSLTKDPVMKLRDLGQIMIQETIDYSNNMRNLFLALGLGGVVVNAVMSTLAWGLAPGSFWGATSGAVDASGITINAVNNVMNIAQHFIVMYVPLAIAVLGPIFVCGITLAIYVPLIPFLLFLFGVMSWLISVVVLMAAAPIICFLMIWGNVSQQDGFLLVREAEQFVMQVIAVFFRPVLMVMGFIIGVVLLYVGVDLLNIGFNKMLQMNIVTNVGSDVLKGIESIGMVIVYTFTMVSLVNMCFSMIHVLYSEVMRAATISAPATGMEEKQLEGVKGGVGQFAEAGSAGVKETAGAMKGAFSLRSESMKGKEKEKTEKGASTQGGKPHNPQSGGGSATGSGEGRA